MAKRGNPDKVKPYEIRTAQEAREKGRNGGIASGKARRRKASLLKCAKTVLEAEMPDKVKNQITKLAGELDDENDTLFTAATAVMVKEAIGGNVLAYRELKDVMRMIEENITVDESMEDDGLSASLEEFARECIDGDQS